MSRFSRIGEHKQHELGCNTEYIYASDEVASRGEVVWDPRLSSSPDVSPWQPLDRHLRIRDDLLQINCLATKTAFVVVFGSQSNLLFSAPFTFLRQTSTGSLFAVRDQHQNCLV